MTLSVKSDPSSPDGGYALLEGTKLAGVTGVTVENTYSGDFLGPDGKWGGTAHDFPVETVAPDVLRLGPDIVDAVPSDLRVTFRAKDGSDLGSVFWVEILVSRQDGARSDHPIIPKPRMPPPSPPPTGTAPKAPDTIPQTPEPSSASDKLPPPSVEPLSPEPSEPQEAPLPQTSVDPTRVRPKPFPPPWAYVALPLVALAIIAAGVLALRPFSRPTEHPAVPSGDSRPVGETTTPVQPDCGPFADRLTAVLALSEDDKVKLGEDALRAGCGTQAFKAFDSSDPRTSEVVAWNLARFYDPSETAPVYRNAAPADAASAAVYYHLWRDRSPRQAKALAALCAAYQGGAASLNRSCSR